MKNVFIKTLKFFLCFFIYIFIALPLFVSAMITRIFLHEVWLVQEDGFSACDNGYWFFKYVRENFPKQKIIYVISKHSPDYNKVKILGKTCTYKSFSHWFYYFLCSKEITTQPHNKPGYYINKHFWFNKTYFLQHGIIRDFTPYISKNMKFKLFVTSAKLEYEFIKNNYGFEQNVVQLLGLARYDNLLNNSCNKKQILIMPTWRNYLKDLNEQQFANSEYFKHWNRLLNNKNLIHILEDKNLRIIFYVHRNLQKFINCFSSSSPSVIIASKKTFDIQPLLKDSAMLITDYSSVFFDMAYMKKPVIWYVFDDNNYFFKHHDRGYFNENDNILGEKVIDERTLIDCLMKNINRNFQLNNKQIENVNKFFKYFDGKNCERTYNFIKTHK